MQKKGLLFKLYDKVFQMLNFEILPACRQLFLTQILMGKNI